MQSHRAVVDSKEQVISAADSQEESVEGSRSDHTLEAIQVTERSRVTRAWTGGGRGGKGKGGGEGKLAMVDL